MRDTLILGGIMVVTFVVLSRFSLVLVYIVYVVGGLLLLLPLFERTRVRSRWALALFAISAVLLIIMGAVKLVWHYAVWTPSHALQQGLPHTIDFIAGTVLGCLLALIFSGELSGKKRSEEMHAA